VFVNTSIIKNSISPGIYRGIAFLFMQEYNHACEKCNQRVRRTIPVKQTELINIIIQAEQQAQSIVADAKQEKQRLRDNLKEDAAKLKNKYIEQADNYIKEVQTREDENTDNAILSANETHRAVMDAMEKRYASNREVWIEKIYTMVIES